MKPEFTTTIFNGEPEFTTTIFNGEASLSTPPTLPYRPEISHHYKTFRKKTFVSHLLSSLPGRWELVGKTSFVFRVVCDHLHAPPPPKVHNQI
jgi:hypothetical protein